MGIESRENVGCEVLLLKGGGFLPICPLCGSRLKYIGSIGIGPKGGLKRVYRCTNPNCPYHDKIGLKC